MSRLIRMDISRARRSLWSLGVPFAFLMAAAVAVVAPQSCAACSCMVQSFTEAADRADVIFSGTVTDREPGKQGEYGPTVAYTFEVSEVYVGDAPSESVVLTADNSAACGFAFEEGQTYLVMARTGGAPGVEQLETDLCTGTTLAADVAPTDLESLGSASAPAAGASGGGATVDESASLRAWYVAGGTLLGGLLVSGILWWRRRRPHEPRP